MPTPPHSPKHSSQHPNQHSPQQIELIARALIVHQSHVLMCRSIAGNYHYLPGGHIEFAEPASEALKRELLEETNQKITVGPLLLTTENTFNDGQTNHHEINLIFQITHLAGLNLSANLPAKLATKEAAEEAAEETRPEIQSQESHIEFTWIDLAAVTDLDIRPPQIKAWLATATPPTPPHLANFEI